VSKDEGPDGEGELLGVMVDDLRESQPLSGIDRGFHGQHAKVLHPLAVEIDGALAFQRIVAEHIAGHVFQIGTQHHVKKALRAPGHILLVRFHQLGYIEPPIPAALRNIRLPLLDPEVGAQDLQSLAVRFDGLDHGRQLQDRQNARVQAPGGENDEVRLPDGSAKGRIHLRLVGEFHRHAVDGKIPPPQSCFPLSANGHSIAVAQHQLTGRSRCRVQPAGNDPDGAGDGIEPFCEGCRIGRTGPAGRHFPEYGRREQQVSQAVSAGLDGGSLPLRADRPSQGGQQSRQRFGTGLPQLFGGNQERIADRLKIVAARRKPVVEELVDQAHQRPGGVMVEVVGSPQAIRQNQR